MARSMPMMRPSRHRRAAKCSSWASAVAGLQAIATARRLGGVVTQPNRAAGQQRNGGKPGRQVPAVETRRKGTPDPAGYARK